MKVRVKLQLKVRHRMGGKLGKILTLKVVVVDEVLINHEGVPRGDSHP